MMYRFLNLLRLLLLKYKWKKKNGHNRTTAVNVFNIENVTVGKKTYGPICALFGEENANLVIGNYVSIAGGVQFMLGGIHHYKRISTYPFQSQVYGIDGNEFECCDIIVEDDVWLGYDVLVLSGVRIGKGSVIGARSVVAKDVPPYSVFIGNQVVRYRFSEEIIKKIQVIDYSKINHIPNDRYQKYCMEEINEDNVDEIVNAFLSSQK